MQSGVAVYLPCGQEEIIEGLGRGQKTGGGGGGLALFQHPFHVAPHLFPGDTKQSALLFSQIPGELVGKITVKGLPLMMNELLWSAGMAVLNQCYSRRGLDAVAGLNIASTFNNLFNVVFIAMGSAVAILVGQLLGAGELEEARDTDTKLITFSVGSSFLLGIVLFLLAGIFPELDNSEDSVKELACGFIRISAVCMPLYAFMHASYFTLRTGGKTFVTFLFDSVFLWGISIPTAFIISRFTGMKVLMMFFCIQMIDLIKCIIGFILVKKGIWLQNLVKK